MKILVISNMYPSKSDPVYGTFVQTFVNGISIRNKNGVTDIVVLKGRSKNFGVKLFKYIHFYLKTLFFPLFYKYDLIYIHFLTYTPVFIRILSCFKEMSLAINVHGGDVLTRSSFAEQLKQFNRPLLRKSKLIISPSIFFKNILLAEFPEISPSKILVSPSGGVNTNIFIPKEKKEYSSFIIGFVSRIDEGKGWDIFVRVIKKLITIGYDIHAEIVGRGAQISYLKEMITEQGLDGVITYLGPIAYKDLPNVYSRFDLFIFPTLLQESLGLVSIEAMSCGVPIIASKIGGITDYLVDGKNGFSATNGDVDDYCNAIRKYLDLSSADKEKLRKGARNTAENYDTKKVFDNLYKHISYI